MAGVQELEKYDYVQFVIPDLNCIPRGKIMTGKFIQKAAQEGFEVGNAICWMGTSFDIPLTILPLIGENLPNENMRPCLETLTPWPWIGGVKGGEDKDKDKSHRIGNVLCDLVLHDGTENFTCPRQLMKSQLDALWRDHGLVLKSAFEYEFNIFHNTESMDPLGGYNQFFMDMRAWGEHHELFCDLTEMLMSMGVEVSTLMPEFSVGQWEMTTDPEEGVRGGDVAFYMKNAVKGFFRTRGYQATFMSKPMLEFLPNGLHLNHSLWTKKGGKLESAFLDKQDPDMLSPTARHWLAGILTHGPALAALCCPTRNCYRRLHSFWAPNKILWGLDDRKALIRVHTAKENIFFENRLPSGSCNPYLAIAATVAAGLDGLNRQLPCPKPGDVQESELPRTLKEALKALEKDEQLCSLLGNGFVEGYVKCKKCYDIEAFNSLELNTEQKQIDWERKRYMAHL